MKKHELPSTISMIVVTILLIIGFTIAWYSAYGRIPIVNGLSFSAADDGRIKVAVTKGGEDIAELEGEASYAELKFTSQVNIGQNQFAPGAYGSVTLYITSLSDKVTGCEITPTMVLLDSEDTEVSDKSVTITGSKLASTSLTDIAARHIKFYTDAAMTDPITEGTPIAFTTAEKGTEKAFTLYWRWYYEYKGTTTDFLMDEADQNSLTDAEKVDVYDLEDTAMGNNLQSIYYRFKLVPVVD